MKKIYIVFMTIFISLFITSYGFSAIKVVSVRGKVAYKYNKQWIPINSAMTSGGLILKEGTKISTGLRSSAVVMIGDHRVTVRQLTMMKISKNILTKSSSRTQIGLRYGKINARVKRMKKLKTIFKISTPVATSSVRGTEQEVSFGPKSGMTVIVISGSVNAGGNNISGRAIFRMKSGSVTPENILFDVVASAMVNVFADNLTDDEKALLGIYGDELLDGSESPVETLNAILAYLNNAAVVINVVWPGGK